MNFERSFGIEIEAIAPAGTSLGEVARAVTNAGVPCEAIAWGRRHLRTGWAVKTDSSLHSETGYEIVSPPIKTPQGFEQIDKVCSALRSLRMQITKDCGLHVHVDIRQPTALNIGALRRLALFYVEHETLIDSLMPASRRGGGNTYIKSIARVSPDAIARCTDITKIAKVLSGRQLDDNREAGRHVKLNFTSFWKFGTVEFRHHSGTIEAVKIRNWVLACLRLVHTAEMSSDTGRAVETARRVIRQVRAGTKNAIVVEMLLRSQGCTTAEVCAATGWKEVSVMGVGHGYGLHITVRPDYGSGKRTRRYYGRRVEDPPQVAPSSRARRPVANGRARTVEEFCERLGMDEDEVKFWKARHALFASPTLAVGR